MKKFSLLLLLTFCLGQQTAFPALKTDTALVRILRMPLDTNRVQALIDLGWKIASEESKKAEVYSDLAFSYSKKIKSQKGEVESLLLKAKCFDYQGKFKNSLAINFAALYASNNIYDKKLKAMALRQIGGIYLALGNIKKAMFYLNQSLSLSKKINYLKGIASSQSDLGSVYDQKSEPNRAIDLYKKSIALKIKIGDMKNLANSYRHISIIYSNKGDFETAINYSLLSLKVSQNIKDKWGYANSLTSLGDLYIKMKNFEKAYTYLNKSLVTHKEIGNIEQISMDYLYLGLIFVESNNFEKAFYFLNNALQIQIKAGNKSEESYTSSVMGNLYAKNRQFQTAFKYFEKSLAIDSEQKNINYIIEDYLDIAKTHYKAGNFIKAKSFVKQAILQIKTHPSLIYLSKVKELEYLLYQKSKNYKAALESYKQYILLRDSILNQDKKTAIALKEAKFEFDKKTLADSLKNVETQKAKDLQIGLQKSDLQKQKIKQNAMLAGILVMLVFAWLLYSRYKAVSLQRKTEKQLMLLEKEQALVEERTRIADEMHDDVGADLSNLLLKIRMNESKQNSSTSHDYSSLKSSANNIIHKIDEIIWSLNAERDTLDELVNFIVKYYQSCLKENQLQGDVQILTTIPQQVLSAKLRRDIFLTTKEVLNNALKHAQANTINLSISYVDKLLQIKIADNGKGFEAEKNYPGNGLKNMRKRLQNSNGKVEINSNNEAGTTVELSVALT